MKVVVFCDLQLFIEFVDVDFVLFCVGEVCVWIVVVGVCYLDLYVKCGEWDVVVFLVMGYEGFGVVIELGEGVMILVVGDYVVLSWVFLCGECCYCCVGYEVWCQKVVMVVVLFGVFFDGILCLSCDGEQFYYYFGVLFFVEEVVVFVFGVVKV